MNIKNPPNIKKKKKKVDNKMPSLILFYIDKKNYFKCQNFFFFPFNPLIIHHLLSFYYHFM